MDDGMREEDIRRIMNSDNFPLENTSEKIEVRL